MTATDTSTSPNDPNDGGETCTYTVVSPEVDSCTFTGPNLLTNGDSYTFTVSGTNADGTGDRLGAVERHHPLEGPRRPDQRRRHRRQPDGHRHLDRRRQQWLADHLVHGDGHGHLGSAERPQRRR